MEKKNYIVAIDLGSSNVVVAVAERDAEGRPVVRSIVSKPSQGVKAGMITNIEQVSNSIKAAVEAVGEELGIRITEAYTGISGDFVRCARHTDHVFTSDPQNGVNRTDVEALFDRMRNVQAPDDETIMERIPQNYLVDENQEVADPVGSFGKRLASTFNFILCAKTPIERLNLALRRLGIRSLGMYANALVTGAAVLSADEKEEGAAVVNIGGGVTDVAVYYRNVPRYIATIPMGAGAINNDIRTLGILERHVDSLKRKFGSAVAELAPENKMVSVKGRTAKETKDILLHNLAVVIESRARDIAEYVAQEIRDSGFGDKLAYGIVLTGGSAQLQHIDELFRRVTGMEVRIGTTEEAVDETSREKVASPAYSTAVGLLAPRRRPRRLRRDRYPASGRCGTARRADDPARDPLLCREARDRRFGSALHTAARGRTDSPADDSRGERRNGRGGARGRSRNRRDAASSETGPARQAQTEVGNPPGRLLHRIGRRRDLSRPTGQGGGKPKQYERENAKPAGNRNERPTKKRLRNYE